MRFEAYAFDFDGTLVDSAAAKRLAFFDIFPDSPGHRAVIEAVLNDDPDGSRHRVIPRMLADMHARGLSLPAGTATEDRISAYATAAIDAVMSCPEVPGAGALLKSLTAAGCKVYVCSNTPDEALGDLLRHRGWDPCLAGYFGYPHEKATSIATILTRHGLAASQCAMVGDGVSDREAAEANGCPFYRIIAPGDLLQHARHWEVRVA